MSWKRFESWYWENPELGFSMDLSRTELEEHDLSQMAERFQKAMEDIHQLEKGAIANPDEGRQVGHYWLRNPDLAPSTEQADAIRGCLDKIIEFTSKVHSGEIAGSAGAFKNVLVIGIGGSALGPQLVAQALRDPANDRLKPWFLDNTDPDGMDLVKSDLGDALGQTLCLVVSKSGSTPETRNGMVEVAHWYREQGLNFAAHAVAVTGEGSKLDKVAIEENWIERFPMWDWVGGRTSETAAVGLLPAALQGLNIKALLDGAAAMDQLTRQNDWKQNPALQLATAWFHATNGKGEKDMVILPYADRLSLLAKYLQQLIMESLGKEFDLEGNVVNQGIAVYGNKGSTDQHAYIQQLREGVPNFFATFIEVLRDRQGSSPEVESDRTSGDFLAGFLMGTRDALSEKGRSSLTITLEKIDAASLGALIALYERAVSFYASFVGINAYHQPGVEAGKKAAAGILELQDNLLKWFRDNPSPDGVSAHEIAATLKMPAKAESIFRILRHLEGSTYHPIQGKTGESPLQRKFFLAK